MGDIVIDNDCLPGEDLLTVVLGCGLKVLLMLGSGVAMEEEVTTQVGVRHTDHLQALIHQCCPHISDPLQPVYLAVRDLATLLSSMPGTLVLHCL